MAKRHVAAHTNEVGNFSESAQHVWYYVPSTSSNYTLSLKGTLKLRHSIKSATINGAYHPTFRSFRMPTTYTRCIARLENVRGISGPFKRGNVLYVLNSFDEGRHVSGVRFGADLHYNQTSGFVRVSAQLRNRARAEAMNKLINQKINLSVAAAEATKTIDWISEKIVRLLKAYQLLRQRKWSELQDHLVRHTARVQKWERGRWRWKEAKTEWTPAQAWLEWWYAFMPLVYDIWGGVEQLREGFREKDLLFSVERTCSAPLDPSDFVGISGLGRLSVNGEAEESVRVKLWGSIRTNLAHANTLGLINPFVVAWELVPFSFVVDWLVPIGDWLESFSADVGVDFVAGTETARVTADVQGTHENPLAISIGSPQPGAVLPSAKAQVFAMNRVLLHDWPVALPYWKNPLSTHHLITALALIKVNRR